MGYDTLPDSGFTAERIEMIETEIDSVKKIIDKVSTEFLDGMQGDALTSVAISEHIQRTLRLNDELSQTWISDNYIVYPQKFEANGVVSYSICFLPKNVASPGLMPLSLFEEDMKGYSFTMNQVGRLFPSKSIEERMASLTRINYLEVKELFTRSLKPYGIKYAKDNQGFQILNEGGTVVYDMTGIGCEAYELALESVQRRVAESNGNLVAREFPDFYHRITENVFGESTAKKVRIARLEISEVMIHQAEEQLLQISIAVSSDESTGGVYSTNLTKKNLEGGSYSQKDIEAIKRIAENTNSQCLRMGYNLQDLRFINFVAVIEEGVAGLKSYRR